LDYLFFPCPSLCGRRILLALNSFSTLHCWIYKSEPFIGVQNNSDSGGTDNDVSLKELEGTSQLAQVFFANVEQVQIESYKTPFLKNGIKEVIAKRHFNHAKQPCGDAMQF